MLLGGTILNQKASLYVIQKRRPIKADEFSEGMKGKRERAVFKSAFPCLHPPHDSPCLPPKQGSAALRAPWVIWSSQAVSDEMEMIIGHGKTVPVRPAELEVLHNYQTLSPERWR